MLNRTNSDNSFGGEFLGQFAKHYRVVHEPVLIAIGSLGLVCNILNLIVLTRPQMRAVANLVLTSLAGTMLIYVALQMFIVSVERSVRLPEFGNDISTYTGALTLWIAYNVASVVHTIVLMHSVFLAVVRFLSLKFPVAAMNICSNRAIQIALIALYISVVLLCVPTYLNTEVQPVQRKNITIYTIYYRKGIRRTLMVYNFWFIGTVCKLLPCAVLVFFTVLLSVRMKLLATRHQQLQSTRLSRRAPPGSSRRSERLRNSAHLLQVIVLIIVIVEAPQGILNILAVIFGVEFSRQVSWNLIDLFAMLTLFYNSITFALYCKMNSQFLLTLKAFLHCVSRQEAPEESGYPTRSNRSDLFKVKTWSSSRDASRMSNSFLAQRRRAPPTWVVCEFHFHRNNAAHRQQEQQILKHAYEHQHDFTFTNGLKCALPLPRARSAHKRHIVATFKCDRYFVGLT